MFLQTKNEITEARACFESPYLSKILRLLQNHVQDFQVIEYKPTLAILKLFLTMLIPRILYFIELISSGGYFF